MKQLLVSALIIWILALMFQSGSMFAEVTDSQSPLDSQGQVSIRSSGPNAYHIPSKRDENHILQRTSLSHSHCLCWDPRKCTLHGASANCSFGCLTSVPQNLPAHITRLNLMCNLFLDLPNFTFARYSKLESLDLSFNLIHSLQNDTFYNLSKLKELTLYNNFLKYRYLVNTGQVFRPLKSLMYLDISENNKESHPLLYPDLVLSYLRNLESLIMDCRPDPVHTGSIFGDGFKNLTKLSALTIYGGFQFRHSVFPAWGLCSQTFKNVETLESLTFAECGIHGYLISGKPFHNLKKLRKLDISGNSNIGIEYLQPIFDGLYDLEHLTELNIGSIANPYSLGHCLDVSVFKKFPSHLTTLTASGNNLEAVDEEVISLLPVNLTTLDLSGNRFSIGSFLRKLPQLENLTTLYLNGLKSRLGFPVYFPYDEGKSLKPKCYNCTTFLNHSEYFRITLPLNLVTVEINNAGLDFDWTNLWIDTPNSLTYLSASGNRFLKLKGTVYGLQSLKCLNLSMCAVRKIKSHFFEKFSSLEDLRLDSNDLGDFLADFTNENVFYPLINLKSLNLTNNAITVLRRAF